MNLASSIVANSSIGSNCNGPITSQGDNISDDATCVTTDMILNDRNTTDPLLDPAGLQDNGGPTRTIALQPASPALDGVTHNVCPPPATDQRGITRPQGTACDIGAFEASVSAPFATLKANVLLLRLTQGHDSFFASGALPLSDQSDGIDPVSEQLMFALADTEGAFFEQTLPPGSFHRIGRKSFVFRAIKGRSGISVMTLRPTRIAGRYAFEILGKNLDLSGADKPPVTVSLQIGDESGAETIVCWDLAKGLICR